MKFTLYEKDKLSLVGTVVPLLKIAMQKCTGRMVTQCILYVFHGLSTVIVAFSTQRFFDSIGVSVEAKTVLPITVMSLVFMAACIIYKHVMSGLQNYNSSVIHIRLVGIFHDLLNRKVSKISAINYESQEYLQLLEKAVRGSTTEGAGFIIIVVLNVLFSYIPYIFAMGVYMYLLHPVLVISIFLVFIPVLVSQLIKIGLYDRLEDNTVQDRRESKYYQECLIGSGLKETRTLGAYNYFINLFHQAQSRIEKKDMDTQHRAARLDILMKSVTLLGYLLILFLMIYFVMQGTVSIGAFAAVFSSINVMFSRLRTMINHQIGNMLSKTGLTSNFTYFLALPERQGAAEKPCKSEIKVVLDHVSFTYPGTTEPAIKDISMSLSNETIAIVGLNGAGKSTLVKLLMGIYEPDSGSVRVRGLDTSEASTEDLFDRTSAVFQNFQNYKMTLKENIAISDMTRIASDDEVHDLFHDVSLDKVVNRLPNGLDTMLATDFGGIELSGGQWQRVAIARGLYRLHDIIVLDEPTSAIDPIEEKRLYEDFSNIVKGKTAVIVTHRIGSARIADRIIVMDDGRIVEEGTHTSLIKDGGRYATMFNSQASWYN